MESIPIGPVVPIVQNKFYALPATAVTIRWTTTNLYTGFGNGTNGLSNASVSYGQGSVITAPFLTSTINSGTVTLSRIP